MDIYSDSKIHPNSITQIFVTSKIPNAQMSKCIEKLWYSKNMWIYKLSQYNRDVHVDIWSVCCESKSSESIAEKQETEDSSCVFQSHVNWDDYPRYMEK